MIAFFWFVIFVLQLLLLGGLARVATGPTPSDRLTATLLLGTTGTALLLLFGVAAGLPSLLDAALVLVLLATIAAVAFTRPHDAAVRSSQKGVSDAA